MADGVGTLIVYRDGSALRCAGEMSLGQMMTRGRCPSAEL
jgi:hypothetical protein